MEGISEAFISDQGWYNNVRMRLSYTNTNPIPIAYMTLTGLKSSSLLTFSTKDDLAPS